MFDSSRLSHAYIINEAFADTLSMAVVCSSRDEKRPCGSCSDCRKAAKNIHPDIIIAEPLDDKLIISVDQIRAIKKDVYIVPNDSIQKAYIIKNADLMNPSAQNALLQILEEPPAHAVFILCTDNPAALLPTVRSRCIELKSSPDFKTDTATKEENTEEVEELAESLADALNDNVKLTRLMFQIDKLDRYSLRLFIEAAREKLVLKAKENTPPPTNATNTTNTNPTSISQADDILLKANEMLDLNVSAGNISGFICASLIK